MKRESMTYVEEFIRNIQLERDIEKNKKLICNAICREFGIQLKINIVENEKNMFFGMCVYPEYDELAQLTALIFNEGSTRDIEEFHRKNMRKSVKIVDIDSILLYDPNLNMSAGEITAILLHEIGHVVASDIMVHKFKRFKELMLKKMNRSGFRRTLNNLKSTYFFNTVMTLPVAQVFSDQFNAELINEKRADNFAVKEGYKEELISALNKMIINGKGSIITKTEAECDQDIEVTVDWTIENLASLQFRKDTLKKSLKIIELTTPSKHVASVIKHIKDTLFSDYKYGGARREIITEAFILSNKRKDKAPSGAIDSSGRVKKLLLRDLDIYRAELERVNTVDDKIFLLERLYDLLDVAEYAQHMLITNPRKVMQSEHTINSYIESLNEIIKLTNAKKISRTKYGLYIKYPSDYEG